MHKPELVILTTHFGTNFSGGSTATCELFERLQDQFSRLVVIGTELGQHRFENLSFMPYRSAAQACRILTSQASENVVFYGDFYNSYLLVRCRLPFFFTYHDNWPELATLSWQFRLQGIYYWHRYQQIFRNASHVFTVSKHKLAQVQAFTPRVSLARNGVAQRPTADSMQHDRRRNMLMVGNIDKRKYQKALELFSLLPDAPEFSIDIYGHANDKRLVKQLENFRFVKFKGYVERIPFEQYKLLLHTSLMENLSIVWCEAILHATPILCFDVGAAREVISQERGCVVRAYDLAEMRRLMLEIEAQDDLITQNANIHASFAAEFDWQHSAQLYRQRMFPQ